MRCLLIASLYRRSRWVTIPCLCAPSRYQIPSIVFLIMQFFEAVGDGLILIKLINATVPNTIDESKMRIKPGSPYHTLENHTLAVQVRTLPSSMIDPYFLKQS
jgi:hypothetical protein